MAEWKLFLAGAVNYVSKSASSQVAFTNSAGNVVIKVDNSTYGTLLLSSQLASLTL
jgi:hypothetical protein